MIRLLNMVEQSAVATKPSAEVRINPFEQTGLGTEVFLQRIVDACASNLAVLDESGKILYASRAWLLSRKQNALAAKTDGLGLKHLGTEPGSASSVSLEMTALAADIQRILDHHEREFHKEYSCKGVSGLRWFLVHAARLDLPESDGFRVLVTREDITRRRQAEEELRNLGGRLIKAQEDERSRIARELHDDLNQRLAILGIELDQLRQRLPSEQIELSVRVDRLWTRAQEISSEIHRLSYQLHPSKLDHLGLAAALKSLCQELSEHQELEIEFQQDGFPAILPQDITLCVFRIAQESLRNVIKHSGARIARVVLRKTMQAIHLHVSDCGCGFDYDSPQSTKGLGFISMRERLRLVGGEISIRSQAERGTQIDVLIPLVSKECAAIGAPPVKISSAGR
jgi:signal transduction histidine kinase